jgi:hypothetical protein
VVVSVPARRTQPATRVRAHGLPAGYSVRRRTDRRAPQRSAARATARYRRRIQLAEAGVCPARRAAGPVAHLYYAGERAVVRYSVSLELWLGRVRVGEKLWQACTQISISCLPINFQGHPRGVANPDLTAVPSPGSSWLRLLPRPAQRRRRRSPPSALQGAPRRLARAARGTL